MPVLILLAFGGAVLDAARAYQQHQAARKTSANSSDNSRAPKTGRLRRAGSTTRRVERLNRRVEAFPSSVVAGRHGYTRAEFFDA